MSVCTYVPVCAVMCSYAQLRVKGIRAVDIRAVDIRAVDIGAVDIGAVDIGAVDIGVSTTKTTPGIAFLF